MKRISYITMVLLLLPMLLMAQKEEKKASKEINYETIFKEEGGVNRLYLLVEKKELAKVENMYILVGSSMGLGDLHSLMLDKKILKKNTFDPRDGREKRLSKVENKLCIHLGDFDPDKCYVSMYTREKDKKPTKAKS